MKFGICCPLADAPSMVEAGFDYVELGAGALADNPNLYDGLPVEATNLFFPGTIRLFGDNRTPYMDHAQKAVRAAGALGVKVMVIGSGASRKAPEGYDVADANRGFVAIAREISDFASSHGITIAPESLNRSETNVGNDLGSFATQLRNLGVSYTADSYHVLFEWNADHPGGTLSPEDWRAQVPTRPAHVHFADLPRNVPELGDPGVVGFVQRLGELGYDGRVSFEGSRGSMTPAEILQRMRALFS